MSLLKYHAPKLTSPAAKTAVPRLDLRAWSRRWNCAWLVAILGVVWMHLVQLSTPSLADDLQAEKINSWEFQRSEDGNNDQWPDGWRRRAGRNFPAYIPINIRPRDPETARIVRNATPDMSRVYLAYKSGKLFRRFIPEATPEPISNFIDRYLVNNCLMIEMDGGAVELESPAFLLDSRFTYTLDGSIQTESLNGHRVWMELLLLDAKGSVVGRGPTRELTGTKPWTTVETNNLSSEDLRMGQVVIHVDPLATNKLGGKVLVDEIRLYRLPKLELKVDAPHHVALPNQPVEITCSVLGINDARSTVSFKIVNHLGQVTDQASAPLDSLPSAELEVPDYKETVRPGFLTNTSKRLSTKNEPAPDVRAEPQSLGTKSNHTNGIARWQLRIAEPGYYRVVVDLGRTVHGGETRQISREVSLAIVENSKVGVSGPFGWSIPSFNAQITPEAIPDLVKLGGVGWLKIPVWFDPKDTKTAERLSVLLDRLDLRKVNCVGVLAQPEDPASENGNQPAAAIFSTPGEWEPRFEPSLTRMSMKLSWFQLGRDNDRSFIGNPNLMPLITDIRKRMQNYAQELQLALTWDYLDPLPEGQELPWAASQMSNEIPFTARELTNVLQNSGKTEHKKWVTLNPLSASRYSTLDRARDLTERMIAIRRYNVEAAFVTTPLDKDTGIFNSDGSVGELFLPWRLLNQHLATASYLGSINMPSGSTNQIFAQGDDGVMILWSDKPVDEQLYLGDDIRATDLWGKSILVERVTSDHNTPEQRIHVGPWPILVTGISVPVAKWRSRFDLENRSLDSVVAQRTELNLNLENTFKESCFGTVSLNAPSLLQLGPATTRLQASANDRQRVSLPMSIRPDANAGKHLLRFDFNISTDREYSFSTYDSLTLGIGNVELRWETVEADAQRAILRLEIANDTPQPVSFQCKLFPPKQAYRPVQITNAPPGTTQREFVLPLNGAELNSDIWIRCEELGTGRVLNYRLPLKAVTPE